MKDTNTDREVGRLDELVMLPRRLTAENGAKALLIGEFLERVELYCPDCLADGEDDDCEMCEGTGIYSEEVTVSWTTIKAIHAKVVEHFGPIHNTELSRPRPEKSDE